MAKKSKIYIKPSKRGTFTAAAKRRGKGVQAFASQVLSNKEAYSPAMVKKANFARNASKWKKEMGGYQLPEYGLGGDIFGGATSGMAAGAAFGPLGAGIGAAVGGIAGLFGGKKKEEAARKQRELQKEANERSLAFAQYEPTGQQYQAMFEKGGIAGVINKPSASPMEIQKALLNERVPLEDRKRFLKSLNKPGQPYRVTMEESPEGGFKSGFERQVTGYEKKWNPRANDGEGGYQYRRIYRGSGDSEVSDILSPEDFKKESAAWKKLTPKQRKEFYQPISDVHPSYTQPIEGFEDGGTMPKKKLPPRAEQMFQQMYLPNPQTQQLIWDTEVERLEEPLEIVDSPIKEVPKKVNFQDFTPFLQSQKVLDAEVEKLEGEPQFQMGGLTQEMLMLGHPNAELEGGESLVTPNGEDVDINGPSHAQGGVEMNLEPGTRIFSDKLKMPGTNKTFSDLNKKLTNKIGKFENTLDDPDSTPLAKRTAERMLGRLKGEQDRLFVDQERLKYKKSGLETKRGTSFRYGGMKKYQDGDMVVEPWMTDLGNYTSASNLVAGTEYDSLLQGLQGSNNLAGAGKTAGDFLGKLGSTLPGIATAAPAIYNIGQGLFGKADTIDPNQFTNTAGMAAAARLRNRRFNVDPQLAASRRAFAEGRRNITGAARTRGELLGNLGGLSAQQAQAVSDIYAQKQNIENQYASEAAQMTAQLGAQDVAGRLGIADINRRTAAAQQNLLGTGLSQLSQLSQAGLRRRGQERADQTRIGALQTIFGDSLQFDPTTGQFKYTGGNV